MTVALALLHLLHGRCWTPSVLITLCQQVVEGGGLSRGEFGDGGFMGEGWLMEKEWGWKEGALGEVV